VLRDRERKKDCHGLPSFDQTSYGATPGENPSPCFDTSGAGLTGCGHASSQEGSRVEFGRARRLWHRRRAMARSMAPGSVPVRPDMPSAGPETRPKCGRPLMALWVLGASLDGPSCCNQPPERKPLVLSASEG